MFGTTQSITGHEGLANIDTARQLYRHAMQTAPDSFETHWEAGLHMHKVSESFFKVIS